MHIYIHEAHFASIGLCAIMGGVNKTKVRVNNKNGVTPTLWGGGGGGGGGGLSTLSTWAHTLLLSCAAQTQ